MLFLQCLAYITFYALASYFDPVFLMMSVFFAIAMIFFFMNLSLFIQNPSFAEKFANLSAFAFALCGIVLSNSDSNWTYCLYIIPNAVYSNWRNQRAIYKSNGIGYNGWIEFGVIIFLSVFYCLLYIYLDLVLPDEFGLKKDPLFCLKKTKMRSVAISTHSNSHLGECLIDEENQGADYEGCPERRRTTNQNTRVIMEIKQVSKKFGDFQALNNINFALKESEITCILGHNGAGKSTLINVICGLYYPTAGNIYLKGQDIVEQPDIIEGCIGYCPSYDVLYENFTCDEYLNYVANIKIIQNKKQEIDKVVNVLNLGLHRSKKASELSGGNRKKLNMAAAILGSPDIIFLDEPSSGVDPTSRRDLWNIIRQLKNANSAMILTTHHLEEAEELANDVILLSKGKIKEYGSINYIKRVYGNGYEITVDGLDPIQKQQLSKVLLENWAEITINEEDYAQVGLIKLIVSNKNVKYLPDILELLQINQSLFTVRANNLEDAYLKMEGGNDEEIEEHKKAQLKELETLFEKSYKGNFMSKIWAMLLRKWLTQFKNIYKVSIMVLFMIIPGGFTIYAFNNILEQFIKRIADPDTISDHVKP